MRVRELGVVREDERGVDSAERHFTVERDVGTRVVAATVGLGRHLGDGVHVELGIDAPFRGAAARFRDLNVRAHANGVCRSIDLAAQPNDASEPQQDTCQQQARFHRILHCFVRGRVRGRTLGRLARLVRPAFLLARVLGRRCRSRAMKLAR